MDHPIAAADLSRTAVAPRKILEDALARCNALDGYQIMFYKRERLGWLDTLQGWETIRAYYRRQPDAIKMVWLNRDSEYSQVVYINGANDDNATALPRHGLLGLAPRPVSFQPGAEVKYGKSLRPVTDFGLANLLRLTFKQMDQARGTGGAPMTYVGRSVPPDLQEPADHVIIRYPHGLTPADRQDVYVSARTGYPIAAYFWQGDTELLAAYLFGEPQPPAPPVSEFRLSGNR